MASHFFLIEMFAITVEPAVVCLKTQIFNNLQRKWMSNVADFLRVNSIWYNLKNLAPNFFNHVVLRIQDKLADRA